MGSPETEKERQRNERQHRVRITQAFALHRYQVTNSQYKLFDRAHKSRRDESSDSEDQPVIYVSWYDAWCIANWVCWGGKWCALPTEAEWEYSCRAGTTMPFHFGEMSDGTQSNINGNYPYGTSKKGEYLNKTRRVGSYPPNAFGLHDMHGNEREWCLDWYGEYPDVPVPQVDPRGPASGEARVRRGGSWYSDARYSRAANRVSGSPVWLSRDYGFRLSRTP